MYEFIITGVALTYISIIPIGQAVMPYIDKLEAKLQAREKQRQQTLLRARPVAPMPN